MIATWVAVGLYATAALVLGWRAHRRSDAGAAYWTAGRRLSAPSVGLSISAGFMSVSWSCVYAAQLFYGYGLGAIWLITLPWLIELFGLYLLARRYHALPAFSQPEMVGDRFGPAARRAVAVAVAVVFLAWGGAEVYVAATLLAPGLGLGTTATIVGISVVVGVYATLGGLRAVVATDKLQYALVAVFVFAVAYLAADGLAAEGLPAWPSTDVLGAQSGRPWADWLAPGMPLIVLTFITYIPAGLFETDLWVRVQAARDDRAARRGMLIACGNAFLFTGLLPAFIALAALVLFPMEGGNIPTALGTDGDAIFAALIDRYAPPWLAAVVAIGLVAAAMSTIDTCANVMALSIGYDLLRVHERPNGTRISQAVMAAVMVATCVFALNTESLWDVFYLSGGILTAAVAFPVAAVFSRRLSGRGVAWSSWAGLLGIIGAYLLEAQGLLAPWQPDWLTATGLSYILWGMASAALGYVLGASTTQPQ